MVLWGHVISGTKQPDPRPALFLDRDGVMIVDKNYLSDPAEVELVPGVTDSLLAAQKAGYLLIGVSNQSGIGRNMFVMDDLNSVMKRFDALLRREGVALDAFYYCPHSPQQNCNCRKPAPGLLTEAAASFDWSVKKSWVIGDKVSDVQFGVDAGMGGILVMTGHGQTQVEKCRAQYGDNEQVRIFQDLPHAITYILGNNRKAGDE